MKSCVKLTKVGVGAILLTALCLPVLSRAADASAGSKAISDLIATYALSIDRADTRMAEQIWSDAPEVSFIHPLGEEHGREQIKENFYRTLA